MTSKTAIVAALIGALALSACNTVNGAGKDLKSAGSAVSSASGEGRK